ncbi:YceI family protein [Dactylosporangium sp. CA-139066]|uniref:YceI family protein n=1 Tax=Dactylosporangium sp. CA-139066 TaxID=3239930 RepID=UPI003D8F5592
MQTWTIEAPVWARFAARNFGFNIVRGRIAVTAGTIEIDPDGRPVRLSGTLDPASIDTGNRRRDRDLRGPRFLDVAHHPHMEITAERIEPTATGWRAAARFRVAGRNTPLWIDGSIDGGLSAAGTARLDLRDAGIRVPRILVGRHVDLSVSARLVQRPTDADGRR